MTALLDAQLAREARASVALDKGDGQTQVLEDWSAVAPAVTVKTKRDVTPPLIRRATAPSVPDPDEKEEVVVEPDLPVEPEDAEIVAFLNLTKAEQAAAVYYGTVAAMSPEEPRWKAGTRAPRLQVGAYTLQPGEIVPGAEYWPRRDAWERTGRIERA